MTMPHAPTLMGFLNVCVKMDSMEMEGPAHVRMYTSTNVHHGYCSRCTLMNKWKVCFSCLSGTHLHMLCITSTYRNGYTLWYLHFYKLAEMCIHCYTSHDVVHAFLPIALARCGVDDNCDPNAVCVNTDTGFVCECLAGYKGNGVDCSKLYSSIKVVWFCYHNMLLFCKIRMQP